MRFATSFYRFYLFLLEWAGEYVENSIIKVQKNHKIGNGLNHNFQINIHKSG